LSIDVFPVVEDAIRSRPNISAARTWWASGIACSSSGPTAPASASTR